MADADLAFDALPYDVIASSRDREAWLAARRDLITASDVAAVLGLHPGVTAAELYETAVNPWRGPLELYARKAGLLAETEENEAMRFGSLLEPVIIEEYAKRTGHVVRPAGELLRSRAYPWIGATLDGEVLMPFSAALECKAVGLRQEDDWADAPPAYYVAQVQAQMLVSGHSRAVVACLIGGQQLIWHEVARDSDMQAAIVSATRDFVRRLREKDPPPPRGTDGDDDALLALFGSHEQENDVELPADAIAWDERLEQIRASVRELYAEKNLIEQQIKAHVGTAKHGVIPGAGYAYRWAAQRRNAYAVKESETRVLRRVKWRGRAA